MYMWAQIMCIQSLAKDTWTDYWKIESFTASRIEILSLGHSGKTKACRQKRQHRLVGRIPLFCFLVFMGVIQQHPVIFTVWYKVSMLWAAFWLDVHAMINQSNLGSWGTVNAWIESFLMGQECRARHSASGKQLTETNSKASYLIGDAGFC